ncbi:5,10-methylenetetrahydrofolate reductase [Planctomycetes bacterium Pan216]|uniref:Methylenetetrahydrofolate reductase n=1 Tax=Kolteria novifilia TaxID=2527975 RepID=A0A518AZN8_9BACT|nr:5,10-methylenetetrahydrofolate reductase [Planctomycetes bacterium Pan216]
MKIAELFSHGRCRISFEVYPPKKQEGLEHLYQVVGELCSFDPGFISCTYGAGGSTRDRTLEIITEIRQRYGVPTTAHFTCVGSTVEEIRAWLTRATELGVENIMALRGDPPKGEAEFKAVEGGLRYANELVALIRSEFPNFGIGVAGYPETHQEAPSPDVDLDNLVRKVDAGADAVFTQLYYDNDDFFRFRDRCHERGISVPIVPGILPILSKKQIERITSMCKARLPEELLEKLAACADDAEAQEQVGVDHARHQCEGLLREGVPGIHLYILNRSASAQRILNGLADLFPVMA